MSFLMSDLRSVDVTPVTGLVESGVGAAVGDVALVTVGDIGPVTVVDVISDSLRDITTAAGDVESGFVSETVDVYMGVVTR